MKPLIIIAISILCSVTLFSQGEITINVEDLKSNEGQVIILLFKKGGGFGVNKEPFRRLKCTSISNKKASFLITKIERGEYAFLVFHDEDNNGKCNTNWIGMPQEGVSKSGKSRGIPKFQNSKFLFNGEQKTFNIKMKYL